MKIGILTQPIKRNYGGILQNYALQTFLKRNNFDPYTINRCLPPVSKLKIIASTLKRSFMKYILRKDIVIRGWRTKKEDAIIYQHIDKFVTEKIILTEKFHKNKFKFIEKYGFDAYIVGSDQVWRPKISPCLTNYFLDFLDGNNHVKKIAYSASFGVDHWEFTPEQTKKCSALAKQFDAISVREDSAIGLCKKYLGAEAIHTLDPVMLLEKEDYIDLIKQDHIPERESILYSYILDKSDEKNALIQKAAKELELHHVSGMPSNSFHLKKSKKDLSDCMYCSIAEWISGFRDAKFVITDSFHGTAFSILFNKPFVVFTNKERGNARLNSILKMFHLENRLITDSVDLYPDLYYLDYTEITKIMEREREKSIAYLLNALH